MGANNNFSHEVASRTIRNESMFVTGVIDAKKANDLATVCLTGTDLHAVNDQVHMVLEGKLAKLPKAHYYK